MRAMSLLAVAVALAGCSAHDPPSGAASSTEIPGVMIVENATPQAPYDYTTAILEGGAYQHERLDALVEATIIWWNVDDEVHSVVSDDGQFAGSGPIPPGGEFVHTFLTAGDFAYHCRYHPEMKGIVIVR